MRKESDFLGFVEIPEDALFGIHAARACENFPVKDVFPLSWYKSLAKVKEAVYSTVVQFVKVGNKQSPEKIKKLYIPSLNKLEVLIAAAREAGDGKHHSHFIVPITCGGAGTSINLNMNEILTNRALQLLGKKPGHHQYLHPLEDANIYQSTNDVIPTSLHVAIMNELNVLEQEINELRHEIESLEKLHASVLRVGYTQMQAALPTTFGRLFSTYSEALSRDWWRVSKCFERLKPVNLGGSAIGTSVNVPRYVLMEAVAQLSQLTGLPLSKAENLQDATSNHDALVEVHGILKALAVNLEKMVGDMRLLSSDIAGVKELQIPEKQVGSSIMPGKVNPVITEFVVSAAHQLYANDQYITALAAQGCLELNAYLPTIGKGMLSSLELLIAACRTCRINLFQGLVVHSEKAYAKMLYTPSITTVLVPYIGYEKASALAQYMKSNEVDILKANKSLSLMKETRLKELLSPSKLTEAGFRLNDLE